MKDQAYTLKTAVAAAMLCGALTAGSWTHDAAAAALQPTTDVTETSTQHSYDGEVAKALNAAEAQKQVDQPDLARAPVSEPPFNERGDMKELWDDVKDAWDATADVFEEGWDSLTDVFDEPTNS
ncbi:MAG: hypothetical protein ACPGO3_13695 [Magnetospiraceae bacterium]